MAAAALVGLTPLTALGLTLDPRSATIVASLGASALLGLSVFTVRSPERTRTG